MMKAVSEETKEYWIIGIAKKWEIQMKMIRQIGDAIIRDNLESVILGSPLNYLY